MKTKLLIPLIAFLIMSSILSPLAQASETNNDSTVDQETKDALADELQFYFEEIVDVLGKTLSKANAVATGAQLALSAYSCRGEL